MIQDSIDMTKEDFITTKATSKVTESNVEPWRIFFDI